MWPYYHKKQGAQVEPLQEEDVDVRHNQAVNVWNGLLKAVELRLVNPYLGINMVRLGAPNLFLGVMIAVPYLAQALAAAIGTGWLLRARRPKRFTAQLFLAARLGFLLLAAVDFWGNKPHAALWFLLAVIVLNLPGALAVIGWQTLLGQVLPPSGRAQAVMWRQWGMNAIGLVTLLVGGWAIGTAPGVHAYGVMDVIAAAVGIGEVLIYQRFRVGEYPTPQVTTWHREAPGLWRDIPFRRFALGAAVFYFGWIFLWPVSLRYQVSGLHATNAWMAIWAATNGAATMFALPVWKRLQKPISTARLVPIAALLLVLVPVGYIWHPSMMGVLGLNIVGGIAGAGMNLLMFVRLLDVVPESTRLMAISAYGILTNLTGGLGAVVAIGALNFWGVPLAAGIAAAMRLLGVALLVWATTTRKWALRAPGMPMEL
ncbi:MAG: MFS transporter [Sulfobacillus thermotolerans]|nr:MFS transporter [Sulfobacillus thermotolerans]